MNESSLPSLTELYISTALYSTINLLKGDKAEIRSFVERARKVEDTIDAYCVQCKEKSMFKGNEIKPYVLKDAGEECIDNFVFGIELNCSRDDQHRMYFFFRIENDDLIKIGQHPSIADLSIASTKQYRKFLGDARYKELTKAIGLKSHGIGVGAFVYLRRIFESLIEEAHEEKKTQSSWDEKEFQNAKMDQKIALLKESLPPFLVENKILYSILSKGIHSLNEEECLEHFDIVLLGIELILDEKIAYQERNEKIAKARQSIQQINQKIS